MLEPKDEQEKELSEESCELEAAAVLPVSCIQHLASSNWKQRISSLETFEKAVEEMQKTQLPCQALVRLLGKEPGWNDTKLQVMQKKLHVVTLIAQKGNFSRTSAQFVLRNLVEKVGDVICGSDTKEALTAVAEACGLPWTAGKVTEMAFLQESPRTHTETLNWLASAIKDFGFEGMEAQDFVGYLKSALVAVHPDVRASAFHLLGVIYLYVGAPLRTFFEDEKPSLLHKIDAEFGKLDGQSPPPPTRRCRKPSKDGGNEKRGGDAQPCWRSDVVDIRKKISAELMAKMQDTNWKVRKEGIEELSRILSDIDTIQPNLGDLPTILQACLHDSNKSIVKQTLIVLQQLARVMGPDIKHHIKTLGMSIIAVLRDSKSSLRAISLMTVETWAAQTGMKDWLEGEDLSADLKKESSSHRQGILGWLADKLPSSNSASTDLFRCVPHLYADLEDSNEEKRMAAHEALSFFLLHLGFDKMSEAASKLKPASQDEVLAMLEKLKAVQPTKSQVRFSKSLPKLPTGKSWFKSNMVSAKECNPPPSFTENAGSSELNLENKNARSEGTVPKVKKLPNMKVQAKFVMKEDSIKPGPIFIIIPKGKEQRAKDEKALKVLRWNFSTPNSKYVEQLKAQMSGCVSNWLQEELFHSNFQHHIKALNVMTKHLQTEKEGVINCLDLILKWLSLRLFDTNTWVLMKTLDYLKSLFVLLIEERYELMESEAASFLPYLLLKMGVTKESILKEVRAIVKQVTVIYPASRTFCYLLEGAQAKNANQRMGCLKELGWLLKAYGPEVCQPNPRKVLKTIITLTGDSNNAVHNAALRVIATARDVFGIEAFKTIGNISDKHMSSLEGNIKAVEAKQGKDEKSCNHFPIARQGLSDTFKQNYGTDYCLEEEEEAEKKKKEEEGDDDEEEMSFLPTDQPEVENADEMAFYSNPKPGKQLQSVIFEPQIKSSSSPNVNMIICQVASGNIGTCIEALLLIQEILRQENKVKIMSGHINQFLIAAVQQLKFLHRLYVTAEEEMRREQVLELYSRVICSMISLFQVESLAQEASAGVLKDLMCSLITLMLDSPVEKPQEGHRISQAVNVLVTKVLEKADQTRLFSSLLLLLCEGMTANTNLFAFSEMVAKCLWNVAKRLPETINDVNVDQILLDTHIFMKALSKEKLQKYQSSYPFRALKTLLHTLCKVKGDEILDHLRLIEDRDESELEAHLWKVLGHSREEQTTTDEDKGSSAEEKTDDTLAEIFKKINCKDTARAGLEELYEYKEKYPAADLIPFLKTSSLLFRSYVKHGLAVIAADRETRQK
ncbi:cytoskeleton-associated protein 5-like [Sceloporus undulatus]|uniref:cytoskeleton-associated protein 5-like n=1 Tax=Sceloporus undulatus TaxID=8520 RepID=UPI001C4C97DE|nr:cytoskeleton-associated protein 5-like [Sceloporus undulatus]